VNDAERKEMMRLVELEYERTASFINGITSTSSTIRGWAITVWLAVLGIALDKSAWELAILAATVAGVFFILDGYHAWLYGEAFMHATRLERISSAYYVALGRGFGDEDDQADLRILLESHRFGMYRNFKRFRFRDLWFVRPRVFFRVFYPFIIVVSVLVSIFLRADKPAEAERCTVPDEAETVVVRCDDVIVIEGT
jgi:hypothetical protein